MKKLIYIVFALIINTKTQAQFTLEHVYPQASAYNISANENQLMVIDFEVSGERYVQIDRTTKNINIYNLSHSLVKTISLASILLNSDGTVGDILYLSQHLFNSDTLIEFIYTNGADGPSQVKTFVYNEIGTVLFSDTAGIPIRTNVPLQQYPIYNTTAGTKMILSYFDNNSNAKVWGLAGTLTTAIDRANTTLANNNVMLANARPNPTNSTTTIEYVLPKGSMQGEVVFYNTQGTEVKRFKVDNTFTSLQITTTDIAAGTYYYQLQTGGNASNTKKLVVVK